MELGTKLRFCVALSVLALILKIIVLASPGWAVVKKNVLVYPKDYVLPQDDGIHVDDMEDKSPEKQHVSISFGIWYYRVCMCAKGDDDDSSENSSEENHDGSGEENHHERHHKCYHGCYYRKKHHKHEKYHDTDKSDGKIMVQKSGESYSDVPTEFKPASDFITKSLEFARYGRHEIATYVTIGIVLAVIGMIGAIKYARGGGVGKHSGRLACSTQVLSTFFFWLAIIKVASYIIQLRMVQEHVSDSGIAKDVRFAVPWCLIVGAIGALIMDISSLFHMILISRDRKQEASEYVYNTEKFGKSKVPTIAPEGYVQLVVPPLYQTEEAGPLPEKQPIA